MALTLACLVSLGSGARAAEDQPGARKPAPPATQTTKAKATAAKIKARAKVKAAADAKLVDINSATKEQLAKIPGLNEAMAQQIIAHRPYLTKEHLVINKALPEGVFFAIRQFVIARQPGVKRAAAPKAKATK
jgi:DNA uptake protein ComE-like DNA-binding protein